MALTKSFLYPWFLFSNLIAVARTFKFFLSCYWWCQHFPFPRYLRRGKKFSHYRVNNPWLKWECKWESGCTFTEAQSARVNYNVPTRFGSETKAHRGRLCARVALNIRNGYTYLCHSLNRVDTIGTWDYIISLSLSLCSFCRGGPTEIPPWP